MSKFSYIFNLQVVVFFAKISCYLNSPIFFSFLVVLGLSLAFKVLEHLLLFVMYSLFMLQSFIFLKGRRLFVRMYCLSIMITTIVTTTTTIMIIIIIIIIIIRIEQVQKSALSGGVRIIKKVLSC